MEPSRPRPFPGAHGRVGAISESAGGTGGTAIGGTFAGLHRGRSLGLTALDPHHSPVVWVPAVPKLSHRDAPHLVPYHTSSTWLSGHGAGWLPRPVLFPSHVRSLGQAGAVPPAVLRGHAVTREAGVRCLGGAGKRRPQPQAAPRRNFPGPRIEDFPARLCTARLCSLVLLSLSPTGRGAALCPQSQQAPGSPTLPACVLVTLLPGRLSLTFPPCTLTSCDQLGASAQPLPAAGACPRSTGTPACAPLRGQDGALCPETAPFCILST